MKKKQMTGLLLAAVLMMGTQARAAVIAFDGFDSATVADPSNGIYQHNLGVTGTGHVGGNIVGFEAADVWIMDPASGYPRAYNNQLLLYVGGSTSRVGSRQLATGLMIGKTVAYGNVDFRLDGIDDGGATKVGFTTQTGASSVGATMRIIWDGSEWDLQAVYNDGVAIAVGTVVNGISLDTDYNVIWGMDETAGTLKVWVDAASTNDAATVTFADYGGSVSTIDDVYFQYDHINGDAYEGILYDNLTLGDTMADVFSDPAGSLLAFDGFDTAVSADASNGIYAHDAGVNGTSHVGGNIVGFNSLDAWITGGTTFPRAYSDQMLLLAGNSSTSRITTRQLDDGLMTGKTVAYGSVDVFLKGIDGIGSAKVGFTTESASSAVGATIRVIWDGAEWDLQAIYNNGALTVGTVMDGISLDTDYNVIWGMDSDNNTLNVWVDAASTSDAATATFTDYASSVSSIDDAYFQYSNIFGDNGSATREGITFDNLALGDSMASVFFEPVGGYAGWAAGWGVDIGASTNDYDSDGLLNLYEYGLGGDPTNALDQGTSPEFGIANISGTNWFGYVHPQLAADQNSGLSYSLELNMDLVSGTWTNAGYVVAGTNVTGGELDFVTNVTDTVAGEKFIRLIIE